MQASVVRLTVACEIHGEDLRVNRGTSIFALNLLRKGLEFALSPRYEDEIEAFLSELYSELLPDTV